MNSQPLTLNGNGKLIPWILGLFIPPMIGVVIAWVSHANAKLGTHGEQIAVMQSQMTDTRDELRRMNFKLDQLLEHRHDNR